MINQAISFLFMATFIGSAFYHVSILYRLFPYLEDKHPEYSEKAGRPRLDTYNIRRQLLAQSIFTKLFYGGTPKDFPQDEYVERMIGRSQTVWLFFSLPSWLGLVVMLFWGAL